MLARIVGWRETRATQIWGKRLSRVRKKRKANVLYEEGSSVFSKKKGFADRKIEKNGLDLGCDRRKGSICNEV